MLNDIHLDNVAENRNKIDKKKQFVREVGWVCQTNVELCCHISSFCQFLLMDLHQSWTMTIDIWKLWQWWWKPPIQLIELEEREGDCKIPGIKDYTSLQPEFPPEKDWKGLIEMKSKNFHHSLVCKISDHITVCKLLRRGRDFRLKFSEWMRRGIKRELCTYIDRIYRISYISYI